MFQLHGATKGRSKSNALCSFHTGKVNNGNDYWKISAIYLPSQRMQENIYPRRHTALWELGNWSFSISMLCGWINMIRNGNNEKTKESTLISITFLFSWANV